jgi:uncharacterized DUF497 family protein
LRVTIGTLRHDQHRDDASVRGQRIGIGEVDGTVVFVVYTDRGDTRRIVSARLANEQERRKWQSFAKP